MTSYEKIFECSLRKIHDVELARQIEFNTELVTQDMIGWLHSAVAKIGPMTHDAITFDDDAMTIEEDLSDIEIELYALGMNIEWLEPLVRRRANISQLFGGKEEKFFSQASHIQVLKDMLYDMEVRVLKIKRDYDYQHNDYIDG